MKMKLSLISAAVALACSNAFAIPALQLDINPGTYDTGTDTTVADADQFTLRAFGKLSTTSLTSPYYISMAVIGPSGSVGPAASALGSFIFNGNTINVTSDMVYGNPPLEALIEHDPGDLAPHGVFPTFFAERSFSFVAANTTAAYNAEGDIPEPGTMYFADFAVDVAGLADGYSIHFDLYNEEAARCGKKPTAACLADIDINDFAPFSHDAESGKKRREPPNEVPEPTSLALLGLGALFAARRKK